MTRAVKRGGLYVTDAELIEKLGVPEKIARAVEDDQPITLKDAAELYRLTVSTLRAEAGRGRLEIFRLGKRDYTTILSMREMIEKCRVAARHRASTWTKPVARGLSETDQISSARVSLRQTLQALKDDFKSTSGKNTHRSAAPRR